MMIHLSIVRSCQIRKDGLQFHRVLDASEGACERLVLPEVRPQLVVSLAHDKTSHLVGKKVCDLIDTCLLGRVCGRGRVSM